VGGIAFDLLTLVLQSLVPVRSSNIKRVFYRSDTLFIQFHGGEIYAYEGVSVTTYAGLMSARSTGGYFARNIETAYPSERIC
jgi:hypothetical protein